MKRLRTLNEQPSGWIASRRDSSRTGTGSSTSRQRWRRAASTGALAILLLVLASPYSLAGDEGDFRIIVNDENPATSIGADELSRIFMKKTKTWTDGTPIQPVDLSGTSGTRKEFSRRVHGRSASAVKNSWQRQVFTGRGTPPPELQSEEDVVTYVRFNRGAIGYVSSQTDSSGVRIVKVVE